MFRRVQARLIAHRPDWPEAAKSDTFRTYFERGFFLNFGANYAAADILTVSIGLNWPKNGRFDRSSCLAKNQTVSRDKNPRQIRCSFGRFLSL